MGAVGGTIWHGIKGARNSPRGDRFIGSIAAIKARAPVVGGNVRSERQRAATTLSLSGRTELMLLGH